MKFVAVTSCPTGIAHTYMAAEALEVAAEEAGHEIVVETQGSAGSTPIPAAVIAAADAVIFAADVDVRDKERFAGKPLIRSGVKRAISDGDGMIAEAVAAAANHVPSATPVAAAPAPDSSVGFGTKLRQWLMTGVSYMIPFVAAGGLLIAIGFLFGGDEIVTKLYGGTFDGVTYQNVAGNFPLGFGTGTTIDTLIGQAGYAGLLFVIGKIAFFMLVPVLSGYIAYAIADRPGLVPGIVGGLIAAAIGAGFLGGLVSGLLAGAVAYYVARTPVPKALRAIMPVVVIPLVSTIVVGIAMFVVVGKPITAATNGLTGFLNGLTGTNKILLGVLLGLMMAFDLGGPVNKVAYAFATAGLTAAGNAVSGAPLEIMAAVMAAGMTPPLAMALATVVRPKLFNEVERENGKAAWLLGATFVSEGAIPFAAADPVRVIPSMMLGSAATGGLSMAFSATLRAPHGGVFVFPVVGHVALYGIAIVIGMAVSAASVIALKSARMQPAITTTAAEAAVAPTAVSA